MGAESVCDGGLRLILTNPMAMVSRPCFSFQIDDVRSFKTSYNALMDSIVAIDKQILGGVPCFAGTRVPVRSLFDHLEAGYTVDYFLAQFPTVRREQVLGLLESASRRTEEDAVAAVKK